ncbi:uracil-DNA glycosylase [Ferrovum myxofaciens]|uniref:uracil-DNA glycosylase n=1 Tax=Ferrovum myxofaciens TaxID=416213 RepID=UPI002357D26B|nr:uracil-DNA glycosylase [Ferrovum myxofaciens]MBU6995479.1 uracil-DNA glycosylase [Ferrovum myxofaciens]
MHTQEACWRELGLWPLWIPRANPLPALPETPPPARKEGESRSIPTPPPVLPDLPVTGDLRQQVASCTRCALHEQRKQAVFGLIHPGSPWMFIGEGPGAEEDARGMPFVGPAGRVLDAMLTALGLERGPQVSIANVVKCRPPHNRTPSDPECATCLPFLRQQIAQVQPRILVLLGKVAARTLLDTPLSMAQLRSTTHLFEGIPTVVTWHPAYLLRTPAEKAGTWADLCGARRLLTEPAQSGSHPQTTPE